MYHLFPVRVAERDALQAHLASAGIETLDSLPRAAARSSRRSRRIAPRDVPRGVARPRDELLSLPLHPRLPDADVARVADERRRRSQKGHVLA